MSKLKIFCGWVGGNADNVRITLTQTMSKSDNVLFEIFWGGGGVAWTLFALPSLR